LKIRLIILQGLALISVFSSLINKIELRSSSHHILHNRAPVLVPTSLPSYKRIVLRGRAGKGPGKPVPFHHVSPLFVIREIIVVDHVLNQAGLLHWVPRAGQDGGWAVRARDRISRDESLGAEQRII